MGVRKTGICPLPALRADLSQRERWSWLLVFLEPNHHSHVSILVQGDCPRVSSPLPLAGEVGPLGPGEGPGRASKSDDLSARLALVT